MSIIRHLFILIVFIFARFAVMANDTLQVKGRFSVHGNLGLTYEGYGLNSKPGGSSFFYARNPWNQARLSFNPVFQFGDVLSVPVNINIAATPTNFAGPWSGIGNGPNKQTLWQWLTNPMNNVGFNPKYKWVELLLGTQYIKLSDLSSGDVGAFGAGISLNPGKFRLKYFTGSSQRGINYLPPDVNGSYQRNHWMLQTGIEEDGNYRILLNLVRGTDKVNSVIAQPISPQPQEGFTYSIVADKIFQNGLYFRTEYARSFFTPDRKQPLSYQLNFDPFLKATTSSINDEAAQVFMGKRSSKWDLGIGMKFMGAGYKSMSYPFMQPDYRDLTFNTRISLFQGRTSLNTSIGQRNNNVSDVTIMSKQLIMSINTSTAFNEHWSLDISYNNTGFQAGSIFTPFGVKNVSNDFNVAPSYTLTAKSITHIFSLNYNFSKYREMLLVLPNTVTDNLTHNVVFTYVPVYQKKELHPDFSFVYFNNNASGTKNRLLTFSSGLGISLKNGKWQLKGQLQYSLGKMQTYLMNKNFIASLQADHKLNDKMNINLLISSNHYKYGDELSPPASLIGANYLETNLRAGFQYRF